MLSSMKETTVFITYNPNVEFEETLAARLHTIGVVSGFTMYLPDRFNSEKKITQETKTRISRSDYFVMFSTKRLSDVVKQEIEYAFDYFRDKSKILIIYDKVYDKNVSGEITKNFTPFYLDKKVVNEQDKLLGEIISMISDKEQTKKIDSLKKQIDNRNAALIALLGVGLGLLVLGIFSKK